MPEGITFSGFFSYAREDAEADPGLVDALASELPQRVNLKLVNDRFDLWRDTDGLRLGDRWAAKIEAQLHTTDILIVLLTPRWLGSAFSLKEYEIFQQVESDRADDDHITSYVAPIIAREIHDKSEQLNDQQRAVYHSIKARQYQRLLAPDFLTLRKADRIKILDDIADDIHGILDRRRNAVRSNRLASTKPITRTGLTIKREFSHQAYNYADVDYVSNAEVLLDRRKAGSVTVWAQADFVERLYIKGKAGRIEFGIRRAHLRLATEPPAKLFKVDELKYAVRQQNISYKTLQNSPDTIGVFIDPPPGKASLGELSLPPADGENYFAKIARVSEHVTLPDITAELVVSLDVEGLYITDARMTLPSPRTLRYIQAIMLAAVDKAALSGDQTVASNEKHCRKLPVRERT
jgi:hypothetical protein